MERVPAEKRKEIGRRLRQLRMERGWTAEQVAKKVGVSQSTISCFENGHRLPSFKTLDRLAGIFGVTSDYIVGVQGGEDELDLTELMAHPIRCKGILLTPEERKQVIEYAEFLIGKRRGRHEGD